MRKSYNYWLAQHAMNSNICALCIQPRNLRKSHIIPNAVFRRIKQRQNSGQLIHFDDFDYTPVQYSQESWWEYLLCADCERTIEEYERYGLALLRGSDRSKTQKHSEGVTFQAHDYARFKLFLTSVIWRAAVSKQPHFSKVVLPDNSREKARVSLLNGKPLRPLYLGCKLLRLIDDTSEADGGFSTENLGQLIISPIFRPQEGRPYYTFLFLFEGFLLEYFVQAIPYKQATEKGAHRDSPILFVPNKSIFRIPELVKLMVSAYDKHDRGMVTLNR